MTAATSPVPLGAGQEIEVRCHPDCSWAGGFTVADVVTDDDGFLYRIRRSGDGAVLPALFPAGHLRMAGPSRLFT